MCKLSIYLFFCFLLSVQVSGQNIHKKVAQKKQVKPTGKQKTSQDTCCRSLEQFRTDLSRLDASQFRKKYKDKSAREIVQALNVIINRAINRENSYKINLLDAVMKPEPNSAKEKPSYAVRLLITDQNSGPGIPLEGTITFDPETNPLPYLNKIKDSSKNLNADLLAYDSGLLIKFSGQDSKLIIPALPPNNKTTETGLGNFSKTFTVILLATGVLCCLIGLIAYLRSRSLLKNTAYSQSKNVPPVQPGSAPMPTASPAIDRRAAVNSRINYAHFIEPDPPVPPDAYKPASEPVNERQAAVVAAAASAPAVQTKKYFFAEIMTTSGPRKKNMSEPDADKDLGEDVCGFVADDKDLLIYLLDGTSDLHCLKDPDNNREYFSSRLLAQSIANQLRLAFTANRSEAMDVVMLRAIQTVKEDWLRAINKLSDNEKNRVRSSIENKSFPECATTLLTGKLSVNGQLTVYRSGDSKLFMFRNAANDKIRFEETTLAHKNEESNDRAFFRLVLNANKEFDILYNKPNYEIIQKENMHTVVVFSDGIGMLTEQLLQQQYDMNAEAVRKEIIYQTQGTADDKSICFISIKGN